MLCFAPGALALEPDQLLLIANKNVPESGELAQYYAQRRNVPADRILLLPLPVTDDIDYAAYEQNVVPAVREYLTKHNLTHKVTCLVIFYGVPLRIAPRPLTAEDSREVNTLKQDLKTLLNQVGPMVEGVEKVAEQIDPGFHPAAGTDLYRYDLRIKAAMTVVRKLNSMPDSPQRQKLMDAANAAYTPLAGRMGVTDVEIKRYLANPPTDPALQAKVLELINQASDINKQIEDLTAHQDDPSQREKLRELRGEYDSPLGYARLLESQLRLLTPSASSFDSELAMLWWPPSPLIGVVDSGGFMNTLNFHTHFNGPVPPALMTARLDAPRADQVHDMIAVSIKVENQGLDGVVAIDSRGRKEIGADGKPDPYGVFDQTLRNLAALLEHKSNLKVALDQNEALFPPHSVLHTALYCGWYSVGHYVPCCDFVMGAVGYHIASYEMVSLHRPGETGWCPNLINDGCVATLGPVAEPYLHSFPKPDEFFPLLLTGKLTLAEVYWKTTPLMGWRMCLVGDPLYTPYQKDPALKLEDLPTDLQGALGSVVLPQTPATTAVK